MRAKRAASEGGTAGALKRAEFHVVVAILLFIAITVLVSVLLGGDEVLERLRAVPLSLFGVMLALSLVNYLTRALRWQVFTARLGMSVPFRRTLVYYVAGFAMTTTPGKLGEAARLWFMERIHGYSYARVAPLFVGDRIGDMNAMAALCVLGLAAFSGYAWTVAVLAMVVGGFTLLLTRPRLLLETVGGAHYWTGRRRPRLFARVRQTIRLTAAIFDGPTFSVATVLSISGWLAECFAFALLLDTLGAPVEFFGAVFIFAFAMVAGALSMLPGGLGGVEGAMIALLVVAGTPLDTAVAATVVIRVTTLWFAVGLGFVGLPLALRHVRRAQIAAVA